MKQSLSRNKKVDVSTKNKPQRMGGNKEGQKVLQHGILQECSIMNKDTAKMYSVRRQYVSRMSDNGLGKQEIRMVYADGVFQE